jgi:hypothetical protein
MVTQVWLGRGSAHYQSPELAILVADPAPAAVDLDHLVGMVAPADRCQAWMNVHVDDPEAIREAVHRERYGVEACRRALEEGWRAPASRRRSTDGVRHKNLKTSNRGFGAS